MLQRNLFSSVDGVSVSLYIWVLNNFQNFTICKESLNLESRKQKEPISTIKYTSSYVYWYSFNDFFKIIIWILSTINSVEEEKITWIIIISKLEINPFLQLPTLSVIGMLPGTPKSTNYPLEGSLVREFSQTTPEECEPSSSGLWRM